MLSDDSEAAHIALLSSIHLLVLLNFHLSYLVHMKNLIQHCIDFNDVKGNTPL